MQLPKQHVAVMAEFLSKYTSEDDLHEMIGICYTVWTERKTGRQALASKRIREYISALKAEIAERRHRKDLSFDQCVSESKWPVSDWLNPCNEDEWEY